MILECLFWSLLKIKDFFDETEIEKAILVRKSWITNFKEKDKIGLLFPN